MTETILTWIWYLTSRDLSALIGLTLIGLSAILYWLQGPTRIAHSLDNIASAIKKGK